MLASFRNINVLALFYASLLYLLYSSVFMYCCLEPCTRNMSSDLPASISL